MLSRDVRVVVAAAVLASLMATPAPAQPVDKRTVFTRFPANILDKIRRHIQRFFQINGKLRADGKKNNRIIPACNYQQRFFKNFGRKNIGARKRRHIALVLIGASPHRDLSFLRPRRLRLDMERIFPCF